VPQFDWTVSDHVTHKPLQRSLFADDSDAEYVFDLWHARRIAYRRNFMPGAYGSDITLANWPQMDYWLKPVIGVSDEERVAALEEARQFSLSFLYWMQTEAARHDGDMAIAACDCAAMFSVRPMDLPSRPIIAKAGASDPNSRFWNSMSTSKRAPGFPARRIFSTA
jgi:hypothetical protein